MLINRILSVSLVLAALSLAPSVQAALYAVKPSLTPDTTIIERREGQPHVYAGPDLQPRGNYSAAELPGANLENANLESAFLFNADLSGADLTGANLESATLGDANLTGTNLSGAVLTGVFGNSLIDMLNAANAQLAIEYTLSEIADLRPGSAMIEITGGNAVIKMKVQESTDLINWSDTGETSEVTLPAPSGGKKFFRFGN
jgi:hypothetical protein